MRTLRSVCDGRGCAPATDALVRSLEARTIQQFCGDFAKLKKADGAREREAGVAQGLAGGIDEKTAHCLSRRHPEPSPLGGRECTTSSFAAVIGRSTVRGSRYTHTVL